MIHANNRKHELCAVVAAFTATNTANIAITSNQESIVPILAAFDLFDSDDEDRDLTKVTLEELPHIRNNSRGFERNYRQIKFDNYFIYIYIQQVLQIPILLRMGYKLYMIQL